MELITCAEWSGREYRAALRALAGGNPEQGRAVLRAALAPVLDGREVLFFNRARHGLTAALRVMASRAPGRREVIFPGYICPGVVDSIEQAGLVPVQADIGPDLNIAPEAAARAMGPATLALIAAHMYGAPARIAELESLCAARDVFLIDDAAQVAGVRVGGRPLGTFGACGLLSFSQSKTLVAGTENAGGGLIINDPSLAGDLRAVWASLPEGRYTAGNLLAFLKDAAWQHPRLEVGEAMLRRLLGARAGYFSAPPMRMAGGPARIAARQVASLEDRIAGRIRVADLYAARLAGQSRIALPQYAPGRYLTRIMLAMPPNLEIEALHQAIRARGIQTRRCYAIDPRFAAGIPVATELGPRLLEVPSHSRMDAATVARICDTVLEVLR